MTAAILSARGLVLTFANRFAGGWRRHLIRAVDEVDLDIHEGETLAIVGESGSGKSSLARMLLSLVRPTHGTIRYRGEPIATLKGIPRRAYRRDVQAVFQDPASSLNPRMRVERTLAHVILEHGLATAATVRGVVAEELRAVGLTPAEQFMARYPHQLSGGQQQRVGVARALAADPPVLLMDEPFSAVDPIVRASLQDELIKLQAELHKTIVLVTHDVEEAVVLADRVVVMSPRPGRAVAEVEVALPRPRRRTDPELGGLRERVYAALGVPQ